MSSSTRLGGIWGVWARGACWGKATEVGGGWGWGGGERGAGLALYLA